MENKHVTNHFTLIYADAIFKKEFLLQVFYVKNNKHFIISRQYYFSTLGVIEQEVREEIR
jgi:hypothetical protein